MQELEALPSALPRRRQRVDYDDDDGDSDDRGKQQSLPDLSCLTVCPGGMMMQSGGGWRDLVI